MSIIIPGSNALKLAGEVSRASGIRISGQASKRFPDGELYVRLENPAVAGEKVLIVQSLYPHQNDSLMELFLIIDAVKRNGGRPYAVIPYFAYARQDKVFQKGESFSLEAIGKMMKALGTEGIITVDAHFRRKEGPFSFFSIPAVNLSAAKLLYEHAKEAAPGWFAVAGPDAGSAQFLAPFRDAVFMEKEKFFREQASGKRDYEVRIKAPQSLSEKKVLLLDDIISSGSTILQAAKAIKAQKGMVIIGCTHGLFLGRSLEEVSKVADYVFCTDTVDSPAARVSVAKLIAKEICKL